MLIENIDRKKFEQLLKYYGTNYEGGSLSKEVLNNMLEKYASNKEHIYKLFGNKLKLEREIETTVSPWEAEKIKKSLISSLPGPQFFFVRSLLSELKIQDFISNVISKEVEVFGVKLPNGLKLSKALTRLCLPKYSHTVLTLHSMSNQKLFSKGKAVVSIDPIDYITMSSNSSGWRSCHRLDGGEYRTGPLAYLVDTSSVICYIESKNKCSVMIGGEGIEHSNKSWRQIALVNPTCSYVMQERQYPDTNSLNENAISQIFTDALNSFNDTNAYGYKNVKCEDLNELHIDHAMDNSTCSLYYNDIINDMFAGANVVYNTSEYVHPNRVVAEKLPVKGEDVMCLSCGEYLRDSESLYCYDCNDSDEY